MNMEPTTVHISGISQKMSVFRRDLLVPTSTCCPGHAFPSAFDLRCTSLTVNRFRTLTLPAPFRGGDSFSRILGKAALEADRGQMARLSAPDAEELSFLRRIGTNAKRTFKV